LPPSNLTPLLSMYQTEIPRSKRGRPTLEAERNLPHEHDGMVVISKKRRNRRALIPKIQVRWRNITIPCRYSDRLTPATLIEAIRLSLQIRQDTLAKATLTPPNNVSATLHLHVTLRSQGIFAGDIVTLVTRHARVYDLYGVQHFVAYRGTRIRFSTFSVSCRIFLLPPFPPNLWSAMKAFLWNPPHDFKTAIFPRNLPSTCALGTNRVPIPSKNLSGPQPETHQEKHGYPHQLRMVPRDTHYKPMNRNTA